MVAQLPSTVGIPCAYTAAKTLKSGQVEGSTRKMLFFNLGFLEIENEVEPDDLAQWIPQGIDLPMDSLIIVGDSEMAVLHDIALYRQSRINLRSRQAGITKRTQTRRKWMEEPFLTLKRYQRGVLNFATRRDSASCWKCRINPEI